MTYQEFLKNAEQTAKDTIEAFKNRKSIETRIPNSFIMSYEDFNKKYGDGMGLEDTGLEANEFDILVFDGDLHLNHNLDSDWVIEQFAKTGNTNHLLAMFVNGNLSIAGDILDKEYLFLQVAGDVYCHYVYCLYGRITVQGSLTALLGVAGDEHSGSIDALGTKNSIPYILSNDQCMRGIKGIDMGGKCVFIGDGRIGGEYDDELMEWNYFKDSHLMLKDGVLPFERLVDLAVFFNYLKNGENPLLTWEEFEK